MNSKIVNKKNQIRSILFVMILMIVSVMVFLKDYTLRELVEVISTANPKFLMIASFFMLLFLLCQAINLTMILRTLGHQITVIRSMQYIFIGYYFGAITPVASGAQPAQIYYMNKDKVHLDLSMISLFYMLFVSQIVILILNAVFVLIRLPELLRLPIWMKYIYASGALYMFILIISLSALMFSKKLVPSLVHFGFKIAVKFRVIKKPDETKAKSEAMLLSYQEKAKLILSHPELFVRVAVITTVQWLVFYLISYMVYRSFGQNEHSGLELMTSQSMVNVSVAAIPLPGAVGVAEKAFLTKFSLYYDQYKLPLAMILNRIINFYLPFVLSFLLYLIIHFKIIRRSKR